MKMRNFFLFSMVIMLLYAAFTIGTNFNSQEVCDKSDPGIHMETDSQVQIINNVVGENSMKQIEAISIVTVQLEYGIKTSKEHVVTCPFCIDKINILFKQHLSTAYKLNSYNFASLIDKPFDAG